MKSILKFSFLIAFAFAISSCSKELETNKPIANDPTIPAQVSGVSVVNGNGNATVKYTVPNDPNLLFVKAVFTITNGKEREVKASFYTNELLLDGFADTLEHQVALYSVSRSEVESAPVIVKIKPLLSPIWKVFKSINVNNAFGGYNLTATNSTESNISIVVTKPNAFKEYEIDNDKSVFTNIQNIVSKVRGLDTTDHRFGFLVQDRWGNKTDTMYKVVKPLFETELSKSNFSAFVLPGDAKQVTNGAALPYAWDGKLGWPYTSFTDQVATGPQPHMVTFSIGQLAKISRVYIRPFPEGTRFYYLSTMKRFEIYGSANPNLNGALDSSWILLGSYTVTKPSGLPYGTDNADDQAIGAAGFNWEADVNAPKVKYIRIRCLENFGGGTAQSINELSVFGDPR
ncbi:MAG TPA: DUF4959 domain-containing protein [Pelobium sp.]|nr:DUF4959 domain-containing protein [Pelobium sp.]